MERADNWQPIDTAPKDGTKIRILKHLRVNFRGAWKEWDVVAEKPVQWGHSIGADAGWFCQHEECLPDVVWALSADGDDKHCTAIGWLPVGAV